MKVKQYLYTIALAGVAFGLASCGASGDHPGYEYAPQMYNSVPYEGLFKFKMKRRGAGYQAVRMVKVNFSTVMSTIHTA